MANLPEPKWAYCLTPGLSAFEGFALRFRSPDIRIWPEHVDHVPSTFYWSSPHIDDTTAPQELIDRTGALKAVYDGAMYLAWGLDHGGTELYGFCTANERPTNYLSGFNQVADVQVEPFSQNVIVRCCHEWENPLVDTVSKLIFLARYDQVTKAMLKYIGVNGITYMSTYALRDWMKQEGWDDQRIAAEAGWSNAQLKDFTNTANNPAYLGPYSRHGGSASLPKRPVPLAEAERPMRRAALAFLEERGKKIGLAAKWSALIR
jgi:hypothetical protein